MRRGPAIAVIALVVAVVAAACGEGDEGAPPTSGGSTTEPTTTTTTSGVDDPHAYFTLDGTAPASHPDRPYSLGFIAIGDDVQIVVEALGEPDHEGAVEGDTPSWSRTWDLPGGAGVRVDSSSVTDEIEYALLEVPSGSPVRFALVEGVTAGSSSVEAAAGAWGVAVEPPEQTPDREFVARQQDCTSDPPFELVVLHEDASTPFDRVLVSRIWCAAPWVDAATGAYDDGYWLASRDGGVTSYGGVQLFGSGPVGDLGTASPVVALEGRFDGSGYWLASAAGQVAAFGEADDHGDASDLDLAAPLIFTDLVVDREGAGYWLASESGGVYTFGDVAFFGAIGRLDRAVEGPVVAMALAHAGTEGYAPVVGYWLVTSEGRVHAFGSARDLGSLTVDATVVDIEATAHGDGYWLTTDEGGVFTFGDAVFYGAAGDDVGSKVVAMTPTFRHAGYWLTTADGQMLAFGDARFYGQVAPA